jgi:hypothetical protein
MFATDYRMHLHFLPNFEAHKRRNEVNENIQGIAKSMAI